MRFLPNFGREGIPREGTPFWGFITFLLTNFAKISERGSSPPCVHLLANVASRKVLTHHPCICSTSYLSFKEFNGKRPMQCCTVFKEKSLKIKDVPTNQSFFANTFCCLLWFFETG
jgi:hypothetical protein